MAKRKVLYIAPGRSTFVESDLNILKDNYSLTSRVSNWGNPVNLPFKLIGQFFFFLFKGWRFDVVLISFGGYWSLIPTLFGKITRKRTLIILNGTDVASLPSIPYGALRKPLIKWFCGLSYQWASKLLPVSDSLIYCENHFSGIKSEARQGLKAFFPNNNTPYSTIPNGFDTHIWKPNEAVQREENSFLAVMNQKQLELKGGDIINEIASAFPEFSFKIVGCTAPDFWRIPNNIQFLGRKTPEELKALYQKTAFYFQLSIFEGFGCALCEAILCGALPIVSSVNALPEITGGNGFILERKDSSQLIELIQNAVNFEAKEDLSRSLIAHVKKEYALEKRLNQLMIELDAE